MPFPIDDFLRETIKQHFRRKSLEWTEDYFLDVLATSSNKYDVYYAVIALRDCGSTKSVPALKDKLHYPMQDVKCTSILTIAHIAGARETELYVNTLLDPAYRDKAYAMWAIFDAADSRAIEGVLAYFRKNLAKMRSGKLAIEILLYGLQYLQKFVAKEPSVSEIFSEVKKSWNLLAEDNRKLIAEHVPDYNWV